VKITKTFDGQSWERITAVKKKIEGLPKIGLGCSKD
jgi:hypothetical protein